MKKILKVIVANIAAFLHIPLLIVSIPFKVIAIAHSIIIDLSTQFMAVLCVAFMLTGIIGTIASIPEVGLGYAIAYGLLFLILVGALFTALIRNLHACTTTFSRNSRIFQENI